MIHIDIWRPLPQLFEDPFVVGRPPKNGILIEEVLVV